MEQLSFIELLKYLSESNVLYSESNVLYIVVLSIVLIFNLALTLWHFVKELKGFQWRYLGAIAGLQIPDKLGIISFFVIPLGLVGILGLGGIVRFFGSAPPAVAVLCMGALIGTRISDSIFIHIRPSRQGYCPNPALGTIPFYLIETALLTVLFFPGLRNHYILAAAGFIGGFSFFLSVLPGLKFIRTIKHVEPWQATTQTPSWVTEDRYETSRAGISFTS
jgi:hypothetical protein